MLFRSPPNHTISMSGMSVTDLVLTSISAMSFHLEADIFVGILCADSDLGIGDLCDRVMPLNAMVSISSTKSTCNSIRL